MQGTTQYRKLNFNFQIMIKTEYLQELVIANTQRRNGVNNSSSDVKKIQSWLTLYEHSNPGAGTATMIDGDFGPATQLAVRNYQSAIEKSRTGIVSQRLFRIMTNPLDMAFSTTGGAVILRDRIKAIAMNHLLQQPRELVINGVPNLGPWVRSYMDGIDGALQFWCVGFVLTIIDQALSELGGDFTDYMPLTKACDVLGEHAQTIGSFVNNYHWRMDSSLVQPGDLFMKRRVMGDWTHMGIITSVHDEVIQTIEGNTNDNGTRDGIGIFHRIRNYHNSKLDVFSIQQMVDDFTPLG